MGDERTVRCPDARPCATCERVIVPGEAHKCVSPKVHQDRVNRHHARSIGMTDVDATGSWGRAVRVTEGG